MASNLMHYHHHHLHHHHNHLDEATAETHKLLIEINSQLALFRDMLIHIGQSKDSPELREKIRKTRRSCVEGCKHTSQLLLPQIKSAIAEGIPADNPHFVLLFFMIQLFLRELAKCSRLIQVVPMDMSNYYAENLNRPGTSNFSNVISQILLCKTITPDFNAEEICSIAKDSEEIEKILQEMQEFMPQQENQTECENMTEVEVSKSSRVGGIEVVESQKSESSSQGTELSASVRAQIERNRQRALMLKQARLIPHPYAKINTSESIEKSIIRVQGTKFIDSGGGFLIEESELQQEINPDELISIPPPIIEPERPTCLECSEKFPDSFLFQNFEYSVCDKCRDNEDKHALITRTLAKTEYLLKDCDFDKREPPLKFISKKNPHNSNWGEMKLYLQLQIEKRALEIWGTPEALEEERRKREEMKEKTKFKKYQKQMKALRMNVRSSLFDRTKAANHTHQFGEEEHIEDDTYRHKCNTCGFEETFEKM